MRSLQDLAAIASQAEVDQVRLRLLSPRERAYALHLADTTGLSLGHAIDVASSGPVPDAFTPQLLAQSIRLVVEAQPSVKPARGKHTTRRQRRAAR